MHKEAEIEEDLHVGLVCGYAISAVKRELLHLKKIKELELERVWHEGVPAVEFCPCLVPRDERISRRQWLLALLYVRYIT